MARARFEALLDVAGGAGGDVVEEELLGHPAAEGDDDVLKELRIGVEVLQVLLRAEIGRAAARAAGDDGDIVHGVRVLEELAHDGVAALVIGGELLCAVAHDLALLLRAHLDLAYGLLDLVGGDEALAVRDGHERGLVEQVLEVGAREAGRAAGNGVEVHIVREGLAPGVDLEYGLAAADVGQADIHAAVEAAGAGQGVVEDVVTVRGGHYDDALVVREAVHLDEQLVEGLLALVVSAAEAGAALAADGVLSRL